MDSLAKVLGTHPTAKAASGKEGVVQGETFGPTLSLRDSYNQEPDLCPPNFALRFVVDPGLAPNKIAA